MKNIVALILISVFFLACNPEEASTSFSQTQNPASGNDKTITTNENEAITFSFTIEQDSQIAESTLLKITKGPSFGSLSNCTQSVNDTISCTYTPNEGFSGTDYIYFNSSYGDFSSNEENVLKITVIADPNTEPTIGEDQSIRMAYNSSALITVYEASDKESKSSELTYTVVTPPTSGTLSDCFQATGNLNCTYTPDNNFTGTDSFTYKVTDSGELDSEEVAKVSIDVIENCVDVKRLGIYLDKNGNGEADDSESLGHVNSYTGELTAAANYNYYSASAHPIVGPTPSGYYGNIFLYEGTDGLSLNMFFNVDEGGSTDNSVTWKIYTKGNNNEDNVVLSDDNGELKETNNSSDYDKKYSGIWRYWSNTDGGVIGPFNGEDFEIKIVMEDKGDVNNINFHSSKSEDDVFLLSDADETETTFFLKYYDIEVCSAIE